jgi:hypothetical protein
VQAADVKQRLPIKYDLAHYTIVDPAYASAVPSGLKDVVAKLYAIDTYLADIATIRSSADAHWPAALFFGPIDLTATDAERERWADYAQQLLDAVETCQPGAPGCYQDALAHVPGIPPPPPPGRVFDVYVKGYGEPNRIDLKRAERTVLLRGDTFTAPLTIVIKGEWTQHWNDQMQELARCTGPFPPALQLTTDDQSFQLGSGGEEILKGITNHAVTKRIHPGGQDLGPDLYVIDGWPQKRRLSAMLVDNNGYTTNQICTRDRPFVLIWQNDVRFNGEQPPDAVTDFVAP